MQGLLLTPGGQQDISRALKGLTSAPGLFRAQQAPDQALAQPSVSPRGLSGGQQALSRVTVSLAKTGGPCR